MMPNQVGAIYDYIFMRPMSSRWSYERMIEAYSSAVFRS